MKGDRLTPAVECATLDQVTSVVVHYVFHVPARLGLATGHPVAA